MPDSLSAQYWVLALGDTCRRWGWRSTSSRTRKQVEHPALTTQAGQLSAQYWVLELGDTCRRWGWRSTSSRTRKQVEHPALTTQFELC